MGCGGLVLKNNEVRLTDSRNHFFGTSMQTFSNQNDIAAYAGERFKSQITRVQRLTDGVDEEILRLPRPDGGWSAATILDHVAVMNRLYLPKLERAAVSAQPSSRRDWRPTVAGRMLRRAVTTSMKTKTMSVFNPEESKSDVDAVNRFVRSQEELLRVLDRSATLHWQSARLSSPASNLVKLNMGDVFIVLAEHTDRHLNQIEILLARHSRAKS